MTCVGMAMGRSAVLLALAGVVSCGGESGLESEVVPTLIAEEELRIGSLDDAETSLTFFSALEIAPDGRIFTVHPQETRVRIHLPDGTPAGTLGGPGEGPGEFTSPGALGFRDGEVWVLDGRTSRVSYFSMAGEFVRDETFRPQTPDDRQTIPPRPWGILADGNFLASSPVPSRLIATGEITSMPFLRLRPDGSVIDTIALQPMGGGQLALSSGGGGFYTRQPFSDSPILTVSPHTMEILTVDRTAREGDPSFRVTKRAMGADTLWSREVPFEPVLLGATVVDSFVNALSETVGDRGFMTRRQAESEIRGQLHVPAHLPAVTRGLLGRDGSVWLSMSDRDPISTRWLVLGPDGDVLGEVVFPARFSVLNARATVVWGMERDELDIPYIVRYAVRPATSLEEVGR